MGAIHGGDIAGGASNNKDMQLRPLIVSGLGALAGAAAAAAHADPARFDLPDSP
jgi:hypothetical protein